MAILRTEISSAQYTDPKTCYLTLFSSHTQRRHDVTIYDPLNDTSLSENSSDEQVARPVIILLHGVYGSHWCWMHLGGVHHVYEKLKAENKLEDFVLVMPSDGGLFEGSGYLPTNNYGDFEQWVIDDVISATKEHVNGVNSASRFYLTGLSMGGYGALRLGSKYADKFFGISAHSSITKLDELALFSSQTVSKNDVATDNEHQLMYWFEKNKALLPPLRLDCGIQDELINGNRAFHQSLEHTQIEHSYDEFSGGHEWAYWHQHISKTFLFFNGIEKQHLSKNNR